MEASSDIYDAIVVGSGGAGCSAAITLADNGKTVLLLTRNDFLDSKTSRAQGGLQAPIFDGDSPELLFEDASKAGEYENVPVLTRILADNAADTIQWLISLGIKFDVDEDGEFLSRGAAGLSKPRVISCGDASGNRIMAPLQKQILSRPIEVSEFQTVYEIDRDENGFQVSTFNPKSNRESTFAARTVILATGGAMPREKRAGLQSESLRVQPDSIMLAENIGLTTKNPELTQFHPTGIVLPKSLRRKPVPELVRTAGAELFNKDNLVFADSMLTRKKLCDAIVEECEAGRGVSTDDGRVGVWLDTPAVDKKHGSGYFKEKFFTLYSKMMAEGHDPTEKPILVYPIAHYTIGGIEIDENCSTNISGIFAAGEATWGVHGADRLMGNSLLEIFVFGQQAALSACRYLSGELR